jgi:hypothetical protein
VICRNTPAAKLACDALFAPGTWKVAGTATTARATVSLHNRAYARGTATISRRGRVRLHLRKLHPMRPGRYLLTLTIGHGRHTRMIRQTIHIR